MPGAALGGLAGWAFSGALVEWGLVETAFGAAMLGASLGSLFDTYSMDNDSTINYSFGPISNTKSQMIPIPIVYGKNRVAGNIFYNNFYDSKKMKQDIMVGISEGPIQSISEIRAGDRPIDHWLYRLSSDYESLNETQKGYITNWCSSNSVNEDSFIEGNWVSVPIDTTPVSGGVSCDSIKVPSECSASAYLCSDADTVDERDPEGDRPYPDDIAFIALTLKAQEGLSGNPVMTSIVEGLKVWTPEGVAYTRNPAWIVYDLIHNSRYGLGISADDIDIDTFEEVADYCDELIEGEPRFTLDYVIDAQKPVADHLSSMLACFRGYFLVRDKIELHVDSPVTSAYKSLDSGNFIEGSFSWWQRSDSDIYNRVVIQWINPDDSWEQTASVFENESDILQRGIVEKQFNLLGISRPEQVGRMGAYLLDTSFGVRNFCSFGLGVKDSDIETGDVISISNPDFTGWSDKWFRVLSVEDTEDDTVKVTCAEYVPEVYNDRVMDVPLPNYNNAERMLTPDTVSNLSVSEHANITIDGTLLVDLNVTWDTPTNSSFGEYYEVLISRDGGSTWSSCGITRPGATNHKISNVSVDQAGDDTKIGVISVSGFSGLSSAIATVAVVVDGATDAYDGIPSDVSTLSITASYTSRTKVDIEWSAVLDKDVVGYELQFGDSWGSAVETINVGIINEIRGYMIPYSVLEHFFSKDSNTNETITLRIKALNRRGNESENAKSATIDISHIPTDPSVSSVYLEPVHLSWVYPSSGECDSYRINMVLSLVDESDVFGFSFEANDPVTGVWVRDPAYLEGGILIQTEFVREQDADLVAEGAYRIFGPPGFYGCDAKVRVISKFPNAEYVRDNTSFWFIRPEAFDSMASPGVQVVRMKGE